MNCSVSAAPTTFDLDGLARLDLRYHALRDRWNGAWIDAHFRDAEPNQRYEDELRAHERQQLEAVEAYARRMGQGWYEVSCAATERARQLDVDLWLDDDTVVKGRWVEDFTFELVEPAADLAKGQRVWATLHGDDPKLRVRKALAMEPTSGTE